jgi:hypothetical protein
VSIECVQRDWAQGLADSGFCVGHDGKNSIEMGYICVHCLPQKVLTAAVKMKFIAGIERELEIAAFERNGR